MTCFCFGLEKYVSNHCFVFRRIGEDWGRFFIGVSESGLKRSVHSPLVDALRNNGPIGLKKVS